MHRTSAEMTDIFWGRVERYARLPVVVKDANYGKTICFSVNTERYIIDPDENTLKQFIASLDQGDHVWRSRIS